MVRQREGLKKISKKMLILIGVGLFCTSFYHTYYEVDAEVENKVVMGKNNTLSQNQLLLHGSDTLYISDTIKESLSRSGQGVTCYTNNIGNRSKEEVAEVFGKPIILLISSLIPLIVHHTSFEEIIGPQLFR